MSFHCGFVGLLGLPNVGKSSLLNKITGETFSIVSAKPQTTRKALTGIRTTGDYQIVFSDAPGYLTQSGGLFTFLKEESNRLIEENDILVIVVAFDQQASEAFDELVEAVKSSGKPMAYVFSKSDLEKSEFVQNLQIDIEAPFLELNNHDKNSDTLDQFLQELASQLPVQQQPMYDREMISLEKTKDIVADMVREQCFQCLHQELPFSMAVRIDKYKEEKKLVRIEATIIVDKENHKGIVVGKGGAMLKEIGKKARHRIEDFLGEKVFLGLHVSHKKQWMKNKSLMEELGYVRQ